MTLPLEALPRAVDRPLHADVRFLSSCLGRVIDRLEGRDCFLAVEGLRLACRRRRRSGSATLARLLPRVDALALPIAMVVARAFTLFFLLSNTAEQVHRVRRRGAHRRDRGPAQSGSFDRTFARLAQEGRTAADVRAALARVEVRPVLTAHPTEATRRTVLALLDRIADLLLARDAGTAAARALAEDGIEAEVEVLWLTGQERPDRPSVLDEASTALWYVENRLLPAAARVTADASRAFEQAFGEPLGSVTLITLGSWVGGDRDGNPFVTPEVTLATCRRLAHSMLGTYLALVRDLVGRLSISTRLRPATAELDAALARGRAAFPHAFEANRRRDAEEPIRLALTFIAERLESTRRQVAARDAGTQAQELHAYAGPAAFEADLSVVRGALHAAGATCAAALRLDPLLAAVRAHGFFGARLDLREDAAVLRETVEALDPERRLRDIQGLERALLAPAGDSPDPSSLPESARRTLDTFAVARQVQDENGEAAASTFIVSMASCAEDLLRVLVLARRAGLVELSGAPPRSRLDVVPLFETLGDLQRGPEVVAALLHGSAWKRQLQARGGRLEVMLGYSDSAKDAGLVAAAWALHRCQLQLAATCATAGIELVLFHGRGGSVGRGGGSPILRALSALPPGTLGGRIKITEQGEVIAQSFGMAPIAERTLEVMLTGTLLALLADWRDGVKPADVARYEETMERLADVACARFRERVHADPRLFELFQAATPVRDLAHVHFGSRPAYRERGQGTFAGLRAIPWIFGWTQCRLMLPGWLGAGSALDAVAREPGGLDTLRQMARDWPFFDNLLANIQMVCAKADLEVARLHVERLAPGSELFGGLEAEYRLTVQRLLEIRGSSHLLADQPMLQASIALRNPYVDPLSLLQVSALARRTGLAEGHADRPVLDRIVALTMNGIAQGLRNTG